MPRQVLVAGPSDHFPPSLRSLIETTPMSAHPYDFAYNFDPTDFYTFDPSDYGLGFSLGGLFKKVLNPLGAVGSKILSTGGSLALAAAPFTGPFAPLVAGAGAAASLVGAYTAPEPKAATAPGSAAPIVATAQPQPAGQYYVTPSGQVVPVAATGTIAGMDTSTLLLIGGAVLVGVLLLTDGKKR